MHIVSRALLATLILVCALRPVAAQILAEVCATHQELEAFCGTRNVKLAFVNRDTSRSTRLHFVDFTLPHPVVTPVAGADSAILPDVSPDGEWIVYTHTGDNDGSLWIMHPDGSGKRQLTNFYDD